MRVRRKRYLHTTVHVHAHMSAHVDAEVRTYTLCRMRVRVRLHCAWGRDVDGNDVTMAIVMAIVNVWSLNLASCGWLFTCALALALARARVHVWQ